MSNSLIVVASTIADLFSATEVSSHVTRILRAYDRTLGSADIEQLPLVDGGEGTLDYLITNSLGSFLEVDATSADGTSAIVPFGISGTKSDDQSSGSLAVIEMCRLAGVATLGERGTTYGIGELIQDGLDEGAFSVLLAHQEPMARDAGLGVAAALGVKFFDAENEELRGDTQPIDIARISRIDASGRSFQLLSSRCFVAMSAASRAVSLEASTGGQEYLEQLANLAAIIKRDCGVSVSTTGLSASAIEFGLQAFLGATIGDGLPLVVEASGISLTDARRAAIVITGDANTLLDPSAAAIISQLPGPRLIVAYSSVSPELSKKLVETLGDWMVYSLQDVPLFQAPLAANASITERRRDVLLRLEKGLPIVYDRLRGVGIPA